MIKRLITLVCISILISSMIASVAYAVKKKDDNFIKSSVLSSLPVLVDRDELSQLNQDLEHNKQKVSTLENKITSISEDSKKKQSKLADENKKLEDKAKKLKDRAKKLESKAQALESQIKSMKSAYGGRGSSVGVSANAATSSTRYTAGNSYAPGNCTWGVKNWNPRVPNYLGNANQWAASAAAMGITVNSTPAVGAVAQTGAGGYGHVALVISVNGNAVTIKEMNGAGGLGSVAIREVSKYEFVYIHV